MIIPRLILTIARIIFQCLAKVQILKLTEALVRERKSLELTLVKTTQNFASVCIIIQRIIICLLIENKNKFEADNKDINFRTQFCLTSVSNGFISTESREVSLNGNVYDFSVDCQIDKADLF